MHVLAAAAAVGATVVSLAGQTDGGFSDGVGTVAQFNAPAAIDLDGNGNIIVADQFNKRIRRVTPDGAVTTLAGNDEGNYADGPGGDAQFNNPTGVSVGLDGNIYVADYQNGLVRRVLSDGGTTSTLANHTFFSGPRDTAVDSKGGVYVTESGAGWVSKLTDTGRDPIVMGLSEPQGVAVDDKGNLYVCNYGRQRVEKVLPNGQMYTIGGNENYGVADGLPGYAMFGRPAGIAVDGKGYVYVADVGTHRIRIISPEGYVGTIAGGNEGFADGPADTARFDGPRGIATNGDGIVYVADWHNQRIRKIAGVDPRALTRPPIGIVRRDVSLGPGLPVPVGANNPGLERVRVQFAGRTIAIRKVTFNDAGNRVVSIHLNGAAKRSVQRSSATKFTIGGTMTDAAGTHTIPNYSLLAK
jgi:sugar lactone lactonase YvrE